MRENIVKEDLEKEIHGFFKRGGKINAYDGADRWGFDDAQEFRMFIHQLRQKLDLPIHPTVWGPNQPGDYKLLKTYSELKEQSIKSFKRGAGHMKKSGRRSYTQCQIAARKLLPTIEDENERELLIEEMMALEASLGNAYIIVTNILRRLSSPQEADAIQLHLPSPN